MACTPGKHTALRKVDGGLAYLNAGSDDNQTFLKLLFCIKCKMVYWDFEEVPLTDQGNIVN